MLLLSNWLNRVLRSGLTVLCCVILMLNALSGCSSKPLMPNSSVPQQIDPGSTMEGQVEVTPTTNKGTLRGTSVSATIETPLPFPTVAGFAPSYLEIKQKIDQIMKRDQYPDGPPRNFEGLADPQMAKEFQSYMDSLRGRTVSNWHGWVLGVSESEYGKSDTSYDMYVRMEQPASSKAVIGGVHLNDVPHQQVRELGFMPSVDTLTPDALGQYRSIAFDGTIAGLEDNGGVILYNPSVRNP